MNESKHYKRLAAVFCALFLLTLAAFIWFHVEQGRADKNRKAERDSWHTQETKLKSELKKLDDSIAKGREIMRLAETKWNTEQSGRLSEIERLKRKERASRANPTVI